MQKIELPIDKNEATPAKPDFNWGLKMLLIFLSFLIISYLAFFIFSYFVLKNISLETEKKWFGDNFTGEKFNYTKVIDYKINEFKKYNFYLEDYDEINAYAMIGGNINITKGLLENIENQEELVFVMAHEIGHIENRDVLKKLTTTIPLQLILMSLGFDIGNGNFSAIDIGGKYLSKDTELNADKYAINIFKKYKINPLCVIPFFTREHNIGDSVMEMLSDHPLNSSRIELLDNLAKKMGFKDNKNCKKIKKMLK